MPAQRLVLEKASSRLAVRTHASGLLARLAHDLEIVASEISGAATLEDEGFSAELVVPVAGLRVAGVLRGDKVDQAALSASDRSEIERKIREEVFSGTREIAVRARGASRDRADISVEIASGRQSLSVALRAREEGELVRASGRVELSMKRLGIKEVKGPLGAFRVDDAVEVLFELTLRPEGSPGA